VIDSPSELVMHEGRSQREGLLVVADTAFAALPEVPSLLWWASAVQPSSPSGACVCDGAASAINQVSTDNEYKYAGHVVTLPAGSVAGLPHELANATLGAVALRLPVGAYLLCVARNEPNVYRANAYTLYSATLFVLPPPPPPPPPPPSSPPAPILVSGTPSLPPRVEVPDEDNALSRCAFADPPNTTSSTGTDSGQGASASTCFTWGDFVALLGGVLGGLIFCSSCCLAVLCRGRRKGDPMNPLVVVLASARMATTVPPNIEVDQGDAGAIYERLRKWTFRVCGCSICIAAVVVVMLLVGQALKQL